MSSYRALFARPKTRALAAACGLGWLSFSSYGLAIVLAVEAATGSFAAAGATVAAFTAGSAVFAPLRGRVVDRRGPRALLLLAPAHAIALAVLVVACASWHSRLALLGSGALAGTATPPLIATARIAWARVAGAELAHVGHALNAALGDAAQVVGPALTSIAAAATSPLVALGLLIPGAAAGALLLAAIAPARDAVDAAAAPGSDEPASAAPARPPDRHRIWGVLRESAGLRVIVVCEVALGAWLGALEVAAPLVATSSGAPELGAAPLSLFAVGSVVLSLWAGRGGWGHTATWRYLVGSVAVALVLPVSLLAPSLVGVTLVACAAGAGFGLLNVALFQLLDELVAPDRAVEAFTWVTTGQAAGLALGSAGAGQLSSDGPSTALLLVAVPAALAAIVALANSARLRRDVAERALKADTPGCPPGPSTCAAR
jgi:hypothetical protein